MVANIYAFGRQLRDEGGHDTWRLDYNVLVRVHNRFRKQLYNPAKTQALLEGVHLGIIRPTRVTYITYEDGSSQTIRDMWTTDERATELSAYWKGETHFELHVSPDNPLQLPPTPYGPPPGLRPQDVAQSSGSGLAEDESAVGRQNAKKEELGEDFWRYRGVLLERVHQKPRIELYEPENVQLPVRWSRILPQRYTKMRFENGTTKDHYDNWTDQLDPSCQKKHGLVSLLLQ